MSKHDEAMMKEIRMMIADKSTQSVTVLADRMVICIREPNGTMIEHEIHKPKVMAECANAIDIDTYIDNVLEVATSRMWLHGWKSLVRWTIKQWTEWTDMQFEEEA